MKTNDINKKKKRNTFSRCFSLKVIPLFPFSAHPAAVVDNCFDCQSVAETTTPQMQTVFIRSWLNSNSIDVESIADRTWFKLAFFLSTQKHQPSPFFRSIVTDQWSVKNNQKLLLFNKVSGFCGCDQHHWHVNACFCWRPFCFSSLFPATVLSSFAHRTGQFFPVYTVVCVCVCVFIKRYWTSLVPKRYFLSNRLVLLVFFKKIARLQLRNLPVLMSKPTI